MILDCSCSVHAALISLGSAQLTNCTCDGQFPQEQEECYDAILHSSAVQQTKNKAGNMAAYTYYIVGLG